jgi:hypothetical protein
VTRSKSGENIQNVILALEYASYDKKVFLIVDSRPGSNNSPAERYALLVPTTAIYYKMIFKREGR